MIYFYNWFNRVINYSLRYFQIVPVCLQLVLVTSLLQTLW